MHASVTIAVAPPNGLAAGTFTGAWSDDDAFAVTVWREPSGISFITYLRVTPTLGVSFVCSSEFVVLQNLTQYTLRRVQTASGGSFCDDLFAPVTTAIDQYSWDPPFDQAAAFTLIYKGFGQNLSGPVAASNGTPMKQWSMIELSIGEEQAMRGAINYYNANPANPFLRLVLEERTYARYESLAEQFGMTIPPSR